MKNWWHESANFSEDQLRRRSENYRAERAMRRLWPWALAVAVIALVGVISIVGASL